MQSFITRVGTFLQSKRFGYSTFGALGGVALAAMMVITVADASGRRFFGHPIWGTYDAVSILLGLLVFLSIVYCAFKQSHFAMTLLTSRLPPRGRLRLRAVVYLVSAIVFWLLSWQLVVYALNEKADGAKLMELAFLPTYPFMLVAAFCSVIVGWLFLMQAIYFFFGKALGFISTSEPVP